MNNRALSLLEILVSLIIVSAIILGIVGIFISGNKYVLHFQSRARVAELTKYFLDPLYKQVRQDQWSNNCLGAVVNCTNQTVNSTQGMERSYNATYLVNTSFANNSNLTKVVVYINWSE